MRTRVIVATVAMFSMVLATPAAAQTAPSGEATTQTVGIELTLGDLVLEYLDSSETLIEGGTLEALNIDTLATTIGDPFAEISVLPLDAAILGEQFGGDRTTIDSTDDAGQTQSVTTPLGTVANLAFNATADDDSALSIVTAADQVAAQLDLLAAGGSLSELLALSSVDADEALSHVGFTVTGLDAGGVVAGILSELPLDVLLAIAADLIELDLGDFLGDELDGYVQDVLDHLDALIDLREGEDGLEDLLGTVAALVDLIETLEDDLATLAALGLDELSLTDLLDMDATTLEALQDLLDDYDDDCEIVGDNLLEELQSLEQCLEGLLTQAIGDLGEVAEDLEGVLDSIAEALGLDGLTGAITDLIGALSGLVEGLIAELLGELEFDAPELGDVAIGMSAQADADGAQAELLCALAGDDVDCEDVLSATDGLVGQVAGAVEGLLDLLGDADGEVGLTLFGGETQTSESATSEAIAVLEVLSLHVPSITIGLDSVFEGLEGLLDDLRLSDLVSDVEGELEELRGILAGELDLLDEVDTILGDTDLLGEASTIVATVDGVLEEGGILDLLADLIAELGDRIDSLVDLDVVSVTTPSLDLVIDPTVTASYTPGAPADDGPTAPAPDDPSDPALPATGGGMALLGLLLIAGAVMLRRRLAPLP